MFTFSIWKHSKEWEDLSKLSGEVISSTWQERRRFDIVALLLSRSKAWSCPHWTCDNRLERSWPRCLCRTSCPWRRDWRYALSTSRPSSLAGEGYNRRLRRSKLLPIRCAPWPVPWSQWAWRRPSPATRSRDPPPNTLPLISIQKHWLSPPNTKEFRKRRRPCPSRRTEVEGTCCPENKDGHMVLVLLTVSSTITNL